MVVNLSSSVNRLIVKYLLKIFHNMIKKFVRYTSNSLIMLLLDIFFYRKKFSFLQEIIKEEIINKRLHFLKIFYILCKPSLFHLQFGTGIPLNHKENENVLTRYHLLRVKKHFFK